MKSISAKQGWLALSPLLVFLTVYLVSSAVASEFGKVPVSMAFLVAAVYAVLITKGKLSERIERFSEGAGDRNILTMIWIFILAGAFAGTAKEMGAIDATVAATLHVVPSKLIFAGLFIASCFISMSIGTSVGTIVALVPLATEMAPNCGMSEAYMAAIIVGGAFFGDNLSFISDTTIAATKVMGCQMRDKFRANIRIVLPAVLIVTAIYMVQGWNVDISNVGSLREWYKILPYLLVIVLALFGTNVSLVLTIGILANAVIGWCCGSFGWVGWMESAGRGIAGMSDLIIVTLLAGGLMGLIRHSGGLDFIIDRLTRHANSKRKAQLSIAALVSLADLCTANNTIAIITTGSIAREISDRFGLDPKRTASLLDTFSCFVQGIIPYGAQLLIAAGLAGISSAAIIPHLYYPFLLGLSALIAIFISKK
ncbi:MAG: Na+/H+ antiporter NhaC family protein [Bacteroidales bacterium]|nr:Na+/H+ antiporter NhaC family protein [Bacteroidales bacterium]